jgi:hypothetical protein
MREEMKVMSAIGPTAGSVIEVPAFAGQAMIGDGRAMPYVEEAVIVDPVEVDQIEAAAVVEEAAAAPVDDEDEAEPAPVAKAPAARKPVAKVARR